MDAKTIDPALSMVMQVAMGSNVGLGTLTRLAFRYARQVHSEEFITQAIAQLRKHGVVPEPLYDLAIDYMAHRISFRVGIHPQHKREWVWIEEQKKT